MKRKLITIVCYLSIAFWFVIMTSSVSLSQVSDSVSTPNYNKRINLSCGIGSIEFMNIGLGVRVIDGFYVNLTVGGAFVQGNGFILPPSGSFVKVGTSWRISDERLTPVISFDAGKAYLDVGKSAPPLFLVSDQATLISILGGLDYRYDSGFNLLLRIGERFSRREFEDDEYYFGFQLGVGYNFN